VFLFIRLWLWIILFHVVKQAHSIISRPTSETAILRCPNEVIGDQTKFLSSFGIIGIGIYSDNINSLIKIPICNL
jgi:hypothetical protein